MQTSTHSRGTDSAAGTPHGSASVATRLAAGFAVVLALVAGVFVLGRLATTETVAMLLTGVWFAVVLAASAAAAWRRRDLALPLAVGYALSVVAAFVLLVLPRLGDTQVDEDIATAAAPAAADTDDATTAGDANDADTDDTDAAGAPGGTGGDTGTDDDGADDARQDDDGADDAQQENDGTAADDGGGAAPAGNVAVATGAFEPLVHPGEGTATVINLAEGGRVLTFSEFATDPGPDLRVYLTEHDPTEGDIGAFVDIGALKGNVGDQQYEIPDDVDLADYPHAVVWCRAFAVGFTSAPLTLEG